MKLEHIKNLPNNELLDLFSLYICVEHYDPFGTPIKITSLRKEGISKDDLEAIILERMNNKN